MSAVTTNATQFRAEYAKKIGQVQIPLADLRTFGVALAARLMAFTPPNDLSQGSAAVARDIRRAVIPLSAQWVNRTFSDPKLKARMLELVGKSASAKKSRAASGGNQVEDIQAILAQLGGKFGGIAVSASFDKAWHQEALSGRRGNVQGPARHATLDVSSVGAYIRTVQANVGKAKGGWSALMQISGGNQSPWIDRHSGQGTAQLTFDPTGATLTATNASPWAKHGGRAGISTQNALRTVAAEQQQRLEESLNRRLAA